MSAISEYQDLRNAQIAYYKMDIKERREYLPRVLGGTEGQYKSSDLDREVDRARQRVKDEGQKISPWNVFGEWHK